ncbi:hypothetical protein F5I97DRAFT_318922 [Phlebopus sp. FC_14]|nr:hypothetical protein F5I97DRAFT_318922 [Phlebopus sp. FC_14]
MSLTLMSSRLEAVPVDVLTQVAFFTIDPSPVANLDTLLHLIMCCRTLYGHLCIHACPQLYARIFRATFDLTGHCRRSRQNMKTATCLASELRTRRRVLRRIRLCQIVDNKLLADLWTVYLMLLESDGLNEMHLHAAGVQGWVLRVLQTDLARTAGGYDDQVLSLAISVASLVLSHNNISNLPSGDRTQILNLLRPFTTPVAKYLSPNSSGVVCGRSSPFFEGSFNPMPCLFDFPNKDDCEDRDDPIHTDYFSRCTILAPNLLSGSVFLTFAFKEVTPLQVPPHLPPTRAVATETERHGPTMEDFFAITRRKTPLVADSFQSCESAIDRGIEQQRPSRSTVHDEDFYRIARYMDAPTETWELQAYIPGLLTGVWEGTYMVAPSPSCPAAAEPCSETSQDFLCRQPIQFRLEEYLAFTPSLPLPVETQVGFDGNVLRNLCASEEESSRRIQFSDGNTAKTYCYEPFRLSGASEGVRYPLNAIDVVIVGETPRRFEAAWGMHNFIGRVRLSDGLISLTRKAKGGGDDGCGTWVFEGYLRSRRTFVGRWSALGTHDHEIIGGIFSVSKTAD